MNIDQFFFLRCFEVFDNQRKYLPCIRVYRHSASWRKSLPREVARGCPWTVLAQAFPVSGIPGVLWAVTLGVINCKGSMHKRKKADSLRKKLVTMRIVKDTKEINATLSSPGGRRALGWKPSGYFWNENSVWGKSCLHSLRSNPPVSQES